MLILQAPMMRWSLMMIHNKVMSASSLKEFARTYSSCLATVSPCPRVRAVRCGTLTQCSPAVSVMFSTQRMLKVRLVCRVFDYRESHSAAGTACARACGSGTVPEKNASRRVPPRYSVRLTARDRTQCDHGRALALAVLRI